MSDAAVIFASTSGARPTGVASSVSSVLFSFSDATVEAIIEAANMITMNSTIGMNVVWLVMNPVTSAAVTGAAPGPALTFCDRLTGSRRAAGLADAVAVAIIERLTPRSIASIAAL